MARVKDKRILTAAKTQTKKQKKTKCHTQGNSNTKEARIYNEENWLMQNNQTGLVAHIIIKNKLEMD